jgi:hypothetical protein
MLLNYKLKTLLIILVLGAFTNVTATEIQSQLKSEITNSENWELVKEENGIRVFVTQYKSIDQTMAYKVKFENTTNKNVSLTWSLVSKDSKNLVLQKNTIVKANHYTIFHNEENPISVRFGEKGSDLNINLNIQ